MAQFLMGKSRKMIANEPLSWFFAGTDSTPARPPVLELHYSSDSNTTANY